MRDRLAREGREIVLPANALVGCVVAIADVCLHQGIVQSRSVVRKAGVHPSELHMAVAIGVMRPIDAASVRQDMRQRTLLSELAVPLPKLLDETEQSSTSDGIKPSRSTCKVPYR